MGLIDIIIVICFLPALYFGIKNGLLKQIISLAVIFLGIWLSIRFADLVSTWILKYLEISKIWVNIISYIIIFSCVAIILSLVGKLMEKVIKVALLGWLNRLLGVILTIGIFALIISVTIYFIDSVNNLVEFIPEYKIEESKLYPFFLKTANSLFPVLKNLF
ncbi:MAG: CvpA family protein [Bacteroidales bacterium]|nr:CvpA family protein [Bacteroidales bacterium]MDD3201736.1 CvpA family protein [Bacteroidales bacterium]